MSGVNFNDDDAERLLAVIRNRVIKDGLSELDEAGYLQFEGSDEHDAVSSPRDRLLRYLTVVEEYVTAHHQGSFHRIMGQLKETLAPGGIARVLVEMPEGSEERLVPLQRLLIPEETAYKFLSVFKEISLLVREGRFLDQDLSQDWEGPQP